jgi:hypothetical protein
MVSLARMATAQIRNQIHRIRDLAANNSDRSWATDSFGKIDRDIARGKMLSRPAELMAML